MASACMPPFPLLRSGLAVVSAAGALTQVIYVIALFACTELDFLEFPGTNREGDSVTHLWAVALVRDIKARKIRGGICNAYLLGQHR